MSAHVLLNLLNELRSLTFYCFFARSLINSIIQFTGAHMPDSIYHMTLKVLLNHSFDVKKLLVCHYVRNMVIDIIS